MNQEVQANAAQPQEVSNTPERFPLMCNDKSFGAKYRIDRDGNISDAVTGVGIAWQREVPVDLCQSSTTRSESAGKCKFSKLLTDDGILVTVGKSEAVAWSVPEVVQGRRPGTVVVFLDGDESNEVASNLVWGTCSRRAGNSNKQLLSDEDAREILASFNPHDPNNCTSRLAKRFGVASTTINNVVSYKTFPHISREPYASNPHIKHQNYFDTYVPGVGTQMYEQYVKLGKIVPITVPTATGASITAAAAVGNSQVQPAPISVPIPDTSQASIYMANSANVSESIASAEEVGVSLERFVNGESQPEPSRITDSGSFGVFMPDDE